MLVIDVERRVRHLPGCRLIPAKGTIEGRYTKAIAALTTRCPECFAETIAREAGRSGRGESTRPRTASPPRRPSALPESAEMAPASLSPRGRALLLEIARCPNAELCLERDPPAHPCAEIVLDQWRETSEGERRARWRAAHYLPEPWQGHLETAPILFVSSNPSISGPVGGQVGEFIPKGQTEWLGHTVTDHPSIRQLGRGPKWEWADEEIVDKYESAFDLFIEGGVRARFDDGTTARATRFWVEVRARAAELIPHRPVRPGIDYALTEAVHCKSKEERGVKDALSTYSGRYLRRTIEASAARVVVVLGKVASRAVHEHLGIEPSTRILEGVELGGRPRSIAFLPHPNARASRSFGARLRADELGAAARRHRLRPVTELLPPRGSQAMRARPDPSEVGPSRATSCVQRSGASGSPTTASARLSSPIAAVPPWR
jgi:hypothetical protein